MYEEHKVLLRTISQLLKKYNDFSIAGKVNLYHKLIEDEYKKGVPQLLKYMTPHNIQKLLTRLRRPYKQIIEIILTTSNTEKDHIIPVIKFN